MSATTLPFPQPSVILREKDGAIDWNAQSCDSTDMATQNMDAPNLILKTDNEITRSRNFVRNTRMFLVDHMSLVHSLSYLLVLRSHTRTLQSIEALVNKRRRSGFGWNLTTTTMPFEPCKL